MIPSKHDAATVKCSCSCRSTCVRSNSCKADVSGRSSKERAFTSQRDNTRTKVKVLESQSDEHELTDGKDACRKVKKKISKAEKKKRKEWKFLVGLMTKLGVEGGQADSQHTSVNPISILNDVCMRNHWAPPKYSKCQDFPMQVKCVFLDRVVIGRGNDKMDAKQDAARKILEILET